MEKASHGFVEYQHKQTVNITGVWSLWVYNNGEAIAVIDGYPVNPKQKANIIASDNCFCDVSLLLTFKPMPITGTANRPDIINNGAVYIPEINPEPVAPEVRQSIIFYIKKQLQ